MTSTTNPIPSTQEVAMSKFFVSCPCGCGEAVEASDAGFTATTVQVAGCTKWIANGVHSSVVRKSWACANAVPQRGVQHRDGLVMFA